VTGGHWRKLWSDVAAVRRGIDERERRGAAIHVEAVRLVGAVREPVGVVVNAVVAHPLDPAQS
jgi:hypothetical protein